MVHYIGEIEVDAISKFEEKQKTNRKSGRSLGKSLPYSRKYGSTPGSVHIQVSLFSEDAKAKAEYLKGLAEANYPIYMGSDRYKGWIDITSEVKLTNYNDMMYEVDFDCDLMPLGQYYAQVVSRKKYISNDFVASGDMIPTVNLPKDTTKIYDAVTPTNEGLVDIHEITPVNIAEGLHITPIKIYDDMNSTDEADWVLVSNLETHEFTGKFVFESGNYRIKPGIKPAVYVWNGEEWVLQYECYYVMVDNSDIKYYAFRGMYVKGNRIYVQHSSTKDNWYISSIGFNGNGIMRPLDSELAQFKHVRMGIHKYCDINGYVAVNSDYATITSNRESDFTQTCGSNGWLLEHVPSTMIPQLCFFNAANVLTFKSSGWCEYQRPIASVSLVNFKDKLFFEAEDGNIYNGTVTADDGANLGYSVVGKGNALSIKFVDYALNPELKPAAGTYAYIARLKASLASANDKIDFALVSSSGLVFDGVNDCVYASNFPLKNDEVTWHVSFKSDSSATQRAIGVNGSIEIDLESNYLIKLYGSNTAFYDMGRSIAQDIGKKVDIVVTVSQTNDEMNTYIYVEGVLERTKQFTGLSTLYDTGSSTLYVGKYIYGAHFDGNIERVAKWDGILNSTQIAGLVSDPDNIPTTDLVLWYRPESIAAGVWQDDSGNGYDGTINGAAYTIPYVKTITAEEIGTEYSYHYFETTYDGVSDSSLKIVPNTNTDDTDFSVDYCIAVPKSYIENLQKQVFCNNDQRITLVPKR